MRQEDVYLCQYPDMVLRFDVDLQALPGLL